MGRPDAPGHARHVGLTDGFHGETSGTRRFDGRRVRPRGVNAAWRCSSSPPRTKSGYLSRQASHNPNTSTSPSPCRQSKAIHLVPLPLCPRSNAPPTLWHSAMVRSKITYYAMLMPERRCEIQQEIEARQAARAAHIAAGLPPDSLEPKEEEQLGEEEEEEMASMEMVEADPELPEQQLPGFNMEQAEAEFAVAQSDEMAEQQAILESI